MRNICWVTIVILAVMFFACTNKVQSDSAMEGHYLTEDIIEISGPFPSDEHIVREENGIKIYQTHALTMAGSPKYKEGFTHFNYVNPDAPKGGTLRLGAIGSFDSFHRYAQRGVWPSGISGLYDTLIVPSLDEIEVYYGLVAQKMEYPEDYSWMIYYINPGARFQDGKPITAEDVVFSFYKFFNEGVGQFHTIYENVDNVEAVDKLKVKFSLKEPDKEMLISLGQLTVLPKHYWESRDFTEPSTEVPLGSGPYIISDYSMGQYVVYERLKEYWALDQPVIKGQLNYDYVRYDYYKDTTVSLEAFKAGEYDFRQENVSKNWATLYTGELFDTGLIIKENITHEEPEGMQCLVFNIQKPFFEDRKVREALIYTLDFEWMNANLFYNQYTRTKSYFQNTKYASRELPSGRELEILEPFRDQLPEEVFTTVYEPPVTDGTGNIRDKIKTALDLLKEAGWELKDTKLINRETGEPMEFEVLFYSPSMERVLTPIQKNMEKMGITMNLRLVDTTQFTNRLRERDFDMISGGYSAMLYPNTNLYFYWHSDYIDYTYNTAGVKNEVIDFLVEKIDEYQDNREMLLHYGRALDRVLLWNYYVIPEWYISSYRVAYWNKFSRPKIRPRYSLGLDTWWIDPEKESKLPEQNF